jgi:hypothetical protein
MRRLARLLGEDLLAILENFAHFSLDLATGLAEAVVYIVREHYRLHRQKQNRKKQ